MAGTSNDSFVMLQLEFLSYKQFTNERLEQIDRKLHYSMSILAEYSKQEFPKFEHELVNLFGNSTKGKKPSYSGSMCGSPNLTGSEWMECNEEEVVTWIRRTDFVQDLEEESENDVETGYKSSPKFDEEPPVYDEMQQKHLIELNCYQEKEFELYTSPPIYDEEPAIEEVKELEIPWNSMNVVSNFEFARRSRGVEVTLEVDCQAPKAKTICLALGQENHEEFLVHDVCCETEQELQEKEKVISLLKLQRISLVKGEERRQILELQISQEQRSNPISTIIGSQFLMRRMQQQLVFQFNLFNYEGFARPAPWRDKKEEGDQNSPGLGIQDSRKNCLRQTEEDWRAKTLAEAEIVKLLKDQQMLQYFQNWKKTCKNMKHQRDVAKVEVILVVLVEVSGGVSKEKVGINQYAMPLTELKYPLFKWKMKAKLINVTVGVPTLSGFLKHYFNLVLSSFQGERRMLLLCMNSGDLDLIVRRILNRSFKLYLFGIKVAWRKLKNMSSPCLGKFVEDLFSRFLHCLHEDMEDF